MARINSSHREKGKQILEYRLALHSGDVFLSPVISSSVSADAVLGKTIDIASFLSKQAEPNQLIISEFAFSQAKAFDHFESAGQYGKSACQRITSHSWPISWTAALSSKMDTVRKQCAHIRRIIQCETHQPEEVPDSNIRFCQVLCQQQNWKSYYLSSTSFTVGLSESLGSLLPRLPRSPPVMFQVTHIQVEMPLANGRAGPGLP